MNIGDRVRVIRGTEEGIITKFLEHNQIEIEIEDGFRIPVLKNEVALVAREELLWFGKNTPKKEDDLDTKAQKIVAETGFFLAFLPLNDQLMAVYVVNNTDIEILTTVGEVKEEYRGLKSYHLKKRSFEKLNEMSLHDFQKWGGFLFQALFFREGFAIPKEPLTKRVSFNPATFFKSKQKVPLIDKMGFMFQLDKENVVSLDPTHLKEQLLEKKSEKNTPIVKSNLKKEIDLHLEALFGDQKVAPNEALHLQLDAFEKYLDKAVAAGLDEVTIIHGVGNGILKNEIQKRLSQAKKDLLIKYFQDARKEKFGYGATYIKIR